MRDNIKNIPEINHRWNSMEIMKPCKYMRQRYIGFYCIAIISWKSSGIQFILSNVRWLNKILQNMTNYQKVTHVLTMLLSISFTNFVHIFKYKVIRKTLNDNITKRKSLLKIFLCAFPLSSSLVNRLIQ